MTRWQHKSHFIAGEWLDGNINRLYIAGEWLNGNINRFYIAGEWLAGDIKRFCIAGERLNGNLKHFLCLSGLDPESSAQCSVAGDPGSSPG